MYLTHWSTTAVRALEPREYKQGDMFKPAGFWFDCDHDWRRWCEAEKYNLVGLCWRHSVRLVKPGALHLATVEDIDKFHAEYRCPMPGGFLRDPLTYVIDWPRVAAKYPGIIIAPYCWPRRMQYLWYYGWDCASGCVWDTSLIRLGKPRRGILGSRIKKTPKK